ncbi:MAG TPA: hypothetical protein PLJ27_11765 [Polyangiaceae bacterium]|jgi:hypothetical protein|nr:hypothetical protein [Polyangiaceae bacterium]HNZ24552.1 hypothetical protein [Polyangiaceae bacterium]HOD21962.1 hypothetical protein [Polyangiaceae bacterium]HOE47928.1 hypothetical protein [Polyangiaceae bacterium]HOH02613.1 hypothetical protein [Polyangiaceae bacterium]
MTEPPRCWVLHGTEHDRTVRINLDTQGKKQTGQWLEIVVGPRIERHENASADREDPGNKRQNGTIVGTQDKTD